LKIASNALETDDFDVVERSALTVLFLNPSNEEALYYLGRVSQQRQEIELAKRRYEAALQVAPAFIDAAYALAQIHTDNSQYDLALKLLDSVIPYNRGFARAFHLRALVLTRLQRLSDAIKDCERAEELYRGQVMEMDKAIDVAARAGFERRRVQQTRRKQSVLNALDSVQKLRLWAEMEAGQETTQKEKSR
jgi:tetratricopeptide (TPR) repeat protein